MFKNLKQFNLPEIEERVLKFWKEHNIFQKSLALRQAPASAKATAGRQGKKAKNFRFFEGPPTANGRPGMHHVLARAFKDIILRYKTMRGYSVLRKAGWDTHGLPVELEVEKELGIKSKQEIEKFGIAEFNARAKASVWRYKAEWEKLTERIGFWLDFENPYITYDNKYIETLWWVLSQISKRGLLKKLYKVVPWCPRCQTPLSSHELGQPGAYKKTKDPSVYVKFKIKNQKSPHQNHSTRAELGTGRSKFDTGQAKIKINEYLLAWTTTPWTLPANVAVAVNPKLTYTKYFAKGKSASGGKIEYIWSYGPPPRVEGIEHGIVEKISGQKLLGKEYEALYSNAGEHKIIAVDFISTEEGTGLVHIAPAFGEDDLRVAGKGEVPITIDGLGIVKKGLPGGGKFIKEADKDIIADLEKRGLLYSSGTIEHEYPYCWRCSTPLIYFARYSWFIEMSKIRNEMIKANKKIKWVPGHIKEGRFGEWLKELKDWTISRNRYWGTPLPIWEHANNAPSPDGFGNADAPMRMNEVKQCDNVLVAGGLEDLNKYRFTKNRFFISRHTESNHNVSGIIASGSERGNYVSQLTKKGLEQAEKIAKALKKEKIDIIYSSPYRRTKQTASIIAKATGAKIVYDGRLAELNTGIFNGRPVSEYKAFFTDPSEEFTKTSPGGENLTDAKRRMFAFVRDINNRHNDKKILIVSHGDPLWVLEGAMKGLSNEEISTLSYPEVGEYRELQLHNLPYNANGELDVHRPFIDEVYLKCKECGEKMARIKEVADVWFDSGAMPFAQWHYPFENKDMVDKKLQYPADYIAEGMDQTRGWFYTLLAVSTLLRRDTPYNNVISFGLLLDKHGQKMSKSKGNVIDPWQMIQKYGTDVVRWYFYTVNPPGEPKRFDENDLGKVLRGLFLMIYNSFNFYQTYGSTRLTTSGQPIKVLDQWIMARLHETTSKVTESLDQYDIGNAAKLVEVFVDDLSRWYIRRSRKNVSGKTLALVLAGLAKLMAPFTPFFAEALHRSLKHESGIKNYESVHLAGWPTISQKSKVKSQKLLSAMAEVRRLASLALAQREKAGIKVRQPLAALKIKNQKSKIKIKELLDILKDEINVKEIIFDSKIKTEIELDTKITPELREEGVMRELVRMAQGLRHDAGYQPQNTINLYLELPVALADIVEKHLDRLRKDVKAKAVGFKKATRVDAQADTKLEDFTIWLGVRKI